MSETSRPVVQVVKPEPVIEGAGVHLRRSIGTRRLDHLDPFLLLDHFESVAPADYEAGFPYHPHRGIELVSGFLPGPVQRHPRIMLVIALLAYTGEGSNRIWEIQNYSREHRMVLAALGALGEQAVFIVRGLDLLGFLIASGEDDDRGGEPLTETF